MIWTCADIPVLDITLVPVDGTVGTGNVNAGNADTFMDPARRLHAMPDYDAVIGATMSTSTALQSNGTG